MPSWKRTFGHAVALCALMIAAPGGVLAQVPAARYAHTTTLLPNGNILIAGGMGSLTTTEIYLTTAAAYMAGPAIVARASHTATLMPDGRVLLVGGRNGATIQSSVQIYNPRTNSVSAGDPLATARYNHTATVLPNGKVLIAGGATTTTGGETSVTELYTVSPTGAGSMDTAASAPLGLARAAHSATLMADGRVFVAGGYISNGSDFAVSTEFFDYSYGAEGRWTPGPALIAKRVFHTATQMGDGRVLMSGGYNAKNEEENLGFLSTAEIYDPVTDRVTPAKNMAARKAHHAAILEGSGKVALFGGLGNIATSYATVTEDFEEGSTVRTDAAGTATDPAASNETLAILIRELQLSANVSGRIVDGEIWFSSPAIHLTDADINLRYPTSSPPWTLTTPHTYARLDGVEVEDGIIEDLTARIYMPTGLVGWKSQDVNSEQDLAQPLSEVTFAGGDLDQGDIANLSGGTLYTRIEIPMPDSDYCGAGQSRIRSGNARLTAANINNTALGWGVELDDGTADFSAWGTCINMAVAQDAQGSTTLSCNVRFDNLGGSVSNSTTTPLASPVDVAGQMVESLQIAVEYAVSCIDATGAAFSTDISTIVIRQMIFADKENYGPDKNEWEFGAPGYPLFSHSATLLPNADAAIFGGRDCSGTTGAGTCDDYTYNPIAGGGAYILQHGVDGTGLAFTSPDTVLMQSKRRSHSSTVLPDGKVLVAGGSDGPVSIATAEIFDPDADEWSSAGSMRVGRSNHSATLLANGKVLVAGGFRSQSSTGATSHAELFFPETRSWVTIKPMISSRSYHSSVLLPNGDVFVYGGFGEGGLYLRTAEIYHSTSMVWEQLPDNALLPFRAQHTATLLHTGNVLIAGGVNVTGVLGESLYDVMVYNPVTRTFSADTADRMPMAGNPPGNGLTTKRHSHTATLLRDGRVLVAGGNDGTGEVGRAVIYDPAVPAGVQSARWTRTDPNGFGPGRDMNIPRLSHAAQLLPNGKVLFTGGFNKQGTPISFNEGFDVDFSTWQLQGRLVAPRGDHSSVLTRDGNVVVMGGYNGVAALNTLEYMYFTHPVDQYTPTPLPRQPLVVSVSTGIFDRGARLTLAGQRFGGAGEASGGSSASGNSHHAHPRVYLQRLDSTGNNGGGSPGFMVDITSAVFDQQLNIAAEAGGLPNWRNWNASSMSFVVPTTAGLLPYGYYHLRVAANSQFSDSKIVIAGPARPSEKPGLPFGALSAVTSITWAWTPISGACDGYSVYSATSGVFISTVSPTSLVNGQIQFIQTGLGPDTSGLIKVAAYTVTGDGPVSVSTTPVYTLSARVPEVRGEAQTTQSILWSWTNNASALSYNVYSASAPGNLLGTSGIASWTQAGLSTNSAYAVSVQAVTPAGAGELTTSATVYTLAAPPIAADPGITNLSSMSFTAMWHENSNPDWTTYSVRGYQISDYGEPPAPDPETVSDISDTHLDIPGLSPNVKYTLDVAAVNGDGILSSYTPLGTTATYAAAPINAIVTSISPSSLSLEWDRNNNSGSTPFQVVYSTDAFVADISTAVHFQSNFTSTGVAIGDLVTGATYSLRIYARNYYGHVTAFASTFTITDNGGGPPGSLSLWVPAETTAAMQATLNDGVERRTVSLRVLPGTFPAGTRLFISRVDPAAAGCGTLPAISLTPVPAAQPAKPIEIGLSYPTNPAPTPIKTLGMARYDPIGRRCVYLRSSVQTSASMVKAETNHLSTFQIMQLNPASGISDARIFPNPLYSSRQGFVTFDRLPALARVRVFTLHGETVFDATANNSGVATWNGENFVGRKVASGIYLVVVTHGGDKKIMKLAVVR